MMASDDTRIERYLRKGFRADAELAGKVGKDDPVLAAIAGSASDKRVPGLWLRLLPLAAALFLITLLAGAIAFKMAGSPGSQIPEVITEVPSARDEFFVLRTEPARKCAVVQEYNNFHISRLHQDEKIGGFILKDVAEDSLKLADQQGAIISLLVKDINGKAEDKLREEVSALGVLYNDNRLDEKYLERLGLIALYGDSSAMAIVKKIAQTQNELSPQAQTILHSNKKASQIRQLIALAQAGQKESRKNAIRVLSAVRSPLAMRCLREIALDPAESMGMYVVNMLGKQQGDHILHSLQTIGREAQSPELRRLANQLTDKLLENKK
ncbi:hypothetical protein ACFL54_01695 [Planctomycetota bacterium]